MRKFLIFHFGIKCLGDPTATRALSLCPGKEKNVRKILILLTMWAFIPVGCVHFNAVSTTIAPTAATPQKYPATVGVYFAPRLVNCEVVGKPDTRYGGEHEYHYRWGPAVQEALTKSVKSAYSNVTVVNMLPRPGEFDRVLTFDLPKVDLLVEFVPGYLSQQAKAKASIKITMEILDGKSMKSLKKLPVMANGSSTQDASGLAA